MKTTNLEEIKQMTKAVATIKPQPAGEGILSLFTIHPILHNNFWFEKMVADGNNDTEAYSFDKPDIFTAWQKDFNRRVDKCNDLGRLYMLWQDPYKMTFMKLCGDFLSPKDYAEYLTESWVTEENPNMDVNVSRREALKMFRKAKKHYLMDKEDLEYWKNLPETITVWRGVSKGRIDLGLSWTDDKSKAEWFRSRFVDAENQGKLLEVTTSKSNVIAYFNTRGEQEILLDVFAVQNQIHVIE